MPGNPLGPVLRRLRPARSPDADLVRRYAAARDEAAFEALVRRHGPMVLAVCRRVLRGGPDAEDAFQATFLVLARKAAAVRDPAAVGNWLYGVAHNVARRLRAANGRRRAAESAAVAEARPPSDDGWCEAAALVDDELARLPARYRVPIVSCGLEGQTIREAAADLGWPVGTVATRLARGRALLARRLTRRGVAVPVVFLSAAAVPEPLVAAAVRGVAAGVVPAAVLAVTNEVTRSMFATKLKAAAAVVLAAGLGVAATVTAQPAPADLPPPPKAAGKADRPAPKGAPTAARKLLDRLRELKPTDGGQALEDPSAAALRDLIKLGPAAVPDVIAELDATDDPFLLRCLGYAARGLNDRRVVPALIRALPKTCLPASSDYGLIAGDADLLAFMQAHSHDKRGLFGTHYSFGRPITEFRSALRALTGMTHGEDELNYINLSGSPRQQALQRGLYRRCAGRWAAWWEQNAKDFVADPRYAKVGLPPAPAPPGPPPAADFPRGPAVKVEGAWSGCLLQSSRAAGAKYVVKDLDTGREGALPAKLRPAAGQPERLDDIAAWAEEEGYDLMGTEYTPPGGGDPHYVLRGLGLTAWQIDAGRRATLEAEVKAAGRFDMGKRAGGLLDPFDPALGRHRAGEPGQYLFRTREGGFGWIFVGVEVHDDTLQAGAPTGGDLDLDPVAFHKGRRYSYTLVWDPGPTPPPAGRN